MNNNQKCMLEVVVKELREEVKVAKIIGHEGLAERLEALTDALVSIFLME